MHKTSLIKPCKKKSFRGRPRLYGRWGCNPGWCRKSSFLVTSFKEYTSSNFQLFAEKNSPSPSLLPLIIFPVVTLVDLDIPLVFVFFCFYILLLPLQWWLLFDSSFEFSLFFLLLFVCCFCIEPMSLLS